MKDMQLRFGIVLLVLVSVVSFMVGRSTRTVVEARRQGEMVRKVQGGDPSLSAVEDGRNIGNQKQEKERG